MSSVLQALSQHAGWLALLALALAVAALVWAAALRKQLRTVSPDIRRLVRDTRGKGFDDVLRDLLGNMEFIGGRLGRVEMAVEELARRHKSTVQRTGLVRYNAEEGLGGDLSFCLALLNGERDGVLLTSNHTLSECRVYLRTVRKGTCTHDLADEEREALEIALHERRPEIDGASRLRRARWRDPQRAPDGDRPTSRKRGRQRAE